MFYDGIFTAIPTEHRKPKTNRKQAQLRNFATYRNIFSGLVTDALNRYHFEGLPETCDEQTMLQALIWYGRVVLFERSGNLLSLAGGGVEGINIYCRPGYAWVYSVNGKVNERIKLYLHGSDEDSFIKSLNTTVNGGEPRGVLIRENRMGYPFVNVVLQYADAIADTYRMLDVIRRNLKRPYIIVCDEQTLATVKDQFNRIDDNEDFIASSGVFPVSKINVLPMTVSGESVRDATALIDWYESKYRILCGMGANNNIDKKGENLISDEIGQNDEYATSVLDKSITFIQEGLDDVNKIFGTNIKVVKNYENNDIQGSDGNGTSRDSVPSDNSRQSESYDL